MDFDTKTNLVFKQLKNEILIGTLHPGERIIVSDVAERYGVSSVPIREALQKLQHEGFIDIVPHSGARVAIFDFDVLNEYILIRTALEPLASKLAAPHITDETIKKLEDIQSQIEDCFIDKDLSSYSDLNKIFHTTIYSSSPYNYLSDLILSLWEKSEFSKSLFINYFEKTEVLVRGHRVWIDALKDRDAEKAFSAATNHKQESYTLLLEIIQNEKTRYIK